MRQGEDQVKVSTGQEFRLAVVEPLLFGHGLALGTVPIPTGVIGDVLETAGIASLDMTA